MDALFSIIDCLRVTACIQICHQFLHSKPRFIHSPAFEISSFFGLSKKLSLHSIYDLDLIDTFSLADETVVSLIPIAVSSTLIDSYSMMNQI